MKIVNMCAAIALSALFSVASYAMFAKMDKECTAEADRARIACVDKMGNHPECERAAEDAKSKCNRDFMHGTRQLPG